MNKSGIIKFSDFFEKSIENKDTNKLDMQIMESIDNNSDDEITETSNFPHMLEEVGDKEDIENSEEDNTDEESDNSDWKNEIETDTKIMESNDNYYLVYKDKSEDFSCDIQLEGSNINNAKVRLILESNDWTLMFNGDIDNKGKCVIPIKKLGILNEGLIGKIRLEVIADDTIFTPWEDDFKVKVSKKVSVKVHESKSYRKSDTKSEIKVNVRK